MGTVGVCQNVVHVRQDVSGYEKRTWVEVGGGR